MCVIMYKPVNKAFPEEAILRNCWDNNPDMGGFMYAYEGSVHIRKGFKTFEDFLDALNKCRAVTGDNIPYVCHFRISTQGYSTSCCQPFPLTSKMKPLTKAKASCSVGVCHNGVLSLTSNGAKDYSDTMKFITDYLSNIIQSLDWYKNKRTITLIENLIKGSRFCILDKNGVCNTLGEGWVEDKGIFYSNKTYSYKKYTPAVWGDDYYWSNEYWDNWRERNKPQQKTQQSKYSYTPRGSYKSVFGEVVNPWEDFYNLTLKKYDFTEDYCPYSVDNDTSYCSNCANKNCCLYATLCLK